MLYSFNIHPNFVYTSFKWTNNARENAAVFCIIVGMENNKTNSTKMIFSENHVQQVKNINPYLVSGENIIAVRRTTSISNLPKMHLGNMPNDGGGLILTDKEKNTIVDEYPSSVLFFKKLIGAAEYIKGKYRWCLWIEKDNLVEALRVESIANRIETVRKYRLSSKRESTRNLSNVPFRFGEIRFKKTNSIIIPRHSSELREYIPIGFLDSKSIIADSALAIYDAEFWIFGVITSRIHMAWVRAVGGKLGNQSRYSADICYNTFPFPEISNKLKETITGYVHHVLAEREKYSEKTNAQLYAFNKMPKGLLEAHHQLDLAIDRCYRSKPFESDEERLEYLFKLYEKMIKEERRNN